MMGHLCLKSFARLFIMFYEMSQDEIFGTFHFFLMVSALVSLFAGSWGDFRPHSLWAMAGKAIYDPKSGVSKFLFGKISTFWV